MRLTFIARHARWSACLHLARQDELPPLQGPLMAIVSRNLPQAHHDEELPQQQLWTGNEAR
jgi:hypothetical protein